MLSKKEGIKLFQPGFLYQAELLVSDKSSRLPTPSLAVYRCVVFWMTGKKTFKKNVPQIGALPQSWTSTEKTESPMVFAIEIGDEEGNIKRAKDGVTPTASPQANILKQPDSHLSMHHPGNKKHRRRVRVHW